MRFIQSKKIQLLFTLALCVMIIAAGSIAWISATQRALNEFTFNPDGVNLHDDFEDPNKDVYVENSGDVPLMVRIKLREYTEIGRGLKIPELGVKSELNTWHTHNGVKNTVDNVAECNATGVDDDDNTVRLHDHWTWIMGGQTYTDDGDPDDTVVYGKPNGQKWYIPAGIEKLDAGGLEAGDLLDEDKELLVDEYGNYIGNKDAVVKGDVDKSGLPTSIKEAEDYENYSEFIAAAADVMEDKSYDTMMNELKLARSKLLSDALQAYVDLLPDLDPEDLKIEQEKLDEARDDLYQLQSELNKTLMEEFGVQLTREAEVLTMDEWEDLGNPLGDYWVIDTDGWCYWASPLEPGEATGLLLDTVLGSAKLKKDRTRYYYGIDVIMQAVTADEVWQFWAPSKPAAKLEIDAYGKASSAAESLLKMLARTVYLDAGDEPVSAGGGSAKTIAAPVVQTTQKGEYWQQSGGIWRFDDGRWRYDGSEWTLDGAEYDFDPVGWWLSDGDWRYIDDYWYFDGESWLYSEPKPPKQDNGEVIVKETEPDPKPEAKEPEDESPGDDGGENSEPPDETDEADKTQDDEASMDTPGIDDDAEDGEGGDTAIPEDEADL